MSFYPALISLRRTSLRFVSSLILTSSLSFSIAACFSCSIYSSYYYLRASSMRPCLPLSFSIRASAYFLRSLSNALPRLLKPFSNSSLIFLMVSSELSAACFLLLSKLSILSLLSRAARVFFYASVRSEISLFFKSSSYWRRSSASSISFSRYLLASSRLFLRASISFFSCSLSSLTISPTRVFGKCVLKISSFSSSCYFWSNSMFLTSRSWVRFWISLVTLASYLTYSSSRSLSSFSNSLSIELICSWYFYFFYGSSSFWTRTYRPFFLSSAALRRSCCFWIFSSSIFSTSSLSSIAFCS